MHRYGAIVDVDPIDRAPRRTVGPLRFTVMPLDEVIAALTASDRPATGRAIHFCNAYNVALADQNPPYADLINAGYAVFSDGVPITWVGKRRYPDLAGRWTRVYGPDVMEGVLAASSNGRHALFGSTPATLAALQSRIAQRWPNANVCVAISPPFGRLTSEDLERFIREISGSNPTHVWVGMGTPKQDYIVNAFAKSIPADILAVGAAFDFIAGTKPQAPTWLQHTGLEWLFRLASEPRRLSSRYLIGNIQFLRALVRM